MQAETFHGDRKLYCGAVTDFGSVVASNFLSVLFLYLFPSPFTIIVKFIIYFH